MSLASKRPANYEPFKLDSAFVESYRDKDPPFGFNGLGILVMLRTYSRLKEDGTKEEWFEIIERVVNGTYNMQKRWIEMCNIKFNMILAQKSAQEMYDRMFNMLFLPPGRGLWAMGSALTEERNLFATLNNCGFVSTADIANDLAKPFLFLMDMSMLGCGVGFDTKGKGLIKICAPDAQNPEHYDITDDREGWVESVKRLLESYFVPGRGVLVFGYSQIRAKGAPIKGFGGTSAGYEVLETLHDSLRAVFDRRIGSPITITDIADTMNHIGVCVVAGNVRRTAEIMFGDPTSEEYVNLKNYKVNPNREGHGWVSNNSVFAEIGMDYSKIAERTCDNGEPGYMWLENARKYSRMNGIEDNKDRRAMGGNPCNEQTLEPYELCCLVETFPHKHKNKKHFLRTMKFAYLYAKTVTLGDTHWPETNAVQKRNRRIGTGISGCMQIEKRIGSHEYKGWLRDAYDIIQEYDNIYSDWFGIPRSIKTTTVKPSGTVSLLAGANPGCHFPIFKTYIRRMSCPANDGLVDIAREQGYKIEESVYQPGISVNIIVPIDESDAGRSADEVSLWEKVEIAAFHQEHWSDNQVSYTASFYREREGKDIPHILNRFQHKLKGISFLPIEEHGHPQPPYERITKEEYDEMMKNIRPLTVHDLRRVKGALDAMPERFCDGDKCTIESRPVRSIIHPIRTLNVSIGGENI